MRRLTSRPSVVRLFASRLLAVQLSVVRLSVARLFLVQLFSIFFLLSPARAAAQDLDEITISGRVADERGASVVGARVSAVLDSTGAARAAETDAEGRYRFVELAPGSYTVRVSSGGFAAATRTHVAAVAGRSLRLDFTLRPASVAAEQTVTAAAGDARIDTTRTVTGGTLARREIEELPLQSRAPLDLVLLLPGVTEEPLTTRDAAEDRDPQSRSAARHAQTPEEAGTFALAGGAAYSNNVTTDGLDNNDDRSARERFQPSAEAVEEVQVITNQFSAPHGHAFADVLLSDRIRRKLPGELTPPVMRLPEILTLKVFPLPPVPPCGFGGRHPPLYLVNFLDLTLIHGEGVLLPFSPLPIQPPDAACCLV